MKNFYTNIWDSYFNTSRSGICDALHDLVPFEQFKKRENTLGGVLILVKLQGIPEKWDPGP